MFRKRLPWIDYAKGVAIILVVYRHVIMGIEGAGLYDGGLLKDINEAVYSFRMPLFFILSGFFVRRSIEKRGIFGFIKYKFNTLLYTYFLWATLSITLQLLFSNYVNSNRSLMHYYYILVMPGAVEPFWFLHTLFTTAVLFVVIERWLKRSNIVLFTLATSLFIITGFIHENWFGVKDICFYFIFFVIGSLFTHFTSKHGNLIANSKLLWILLPIFIINQFFWMYNPDYKGLNRFSDMEGLINKLLFIEIATIGSFFLIILSYLISKRDNMKLLRIIGKHSLYIYIMHIMISSIVRTICIKFLHISDAANLLFIGVLAGIFIPIVIYKLSNMFGFWFLYSLEKPNNKKEKNNLSRSLIT